MKKLLPGIAIAVALSFSGSGMAQTSKTASIAILNIQAAIAESNDGQEAAKMLREKFAPKRAELEKQQKDIADLQNQLRNQEKTLSEEARTRLIRTLDDKTRAFNRANEDATTEFQQAEQDAINEIGRKIVQVIAEHAQKMGYGIVLDVSSPQTPVLYADVAIDITDKVIELYNQATAKTTGGASPQPAAGSPPQPAATAPPPQATTP